MLLFIFSLNDYSVLLLLPFVHCMLYCLLLLYKGISQGQAAPLWLALLVGLCALYLTPFMLGYAGWYGEQPYRDILFYLPLQQVLLIGPALYFYTQSLLNRQFALTKGQALHLLPAALYLLYSIIVVVTDKLVVGDYYFYANQKDKDLLPWYQVVGLLHMLFYLALSLRYYRLYRRLTVNVLSNADEVVFAWIGRYLLVFMGILLLRSGAMIILPAWNSFGRWFPYYMAFGLLAGYVAIQGYTNNTLSTLRFAATPLAKSAKVLPSNTTVTTPTPAAAAAAPPPPPPLEVSASNAPPSTALQVPAPKTTTLPNLAAWQEKLSAYMQAQTPYKDPGLTLMQVAQALHTHPKQISQVINAGFGQNFNDYINQHRIKGVEQALAAGQQQQKTLLGIALECGFNSKSTFNRAFYKVHGQSPNNWLKNVAQKGVKS